MHTGNRRVRWRAATRDRIPPKRRRSRRNAIPARGEACPFRQGVKPGRIPPGKQGGCFPYGGSPLPARGHGLQGGSPLPAADPARRFTPSSKVFSTALPEGDTQRGYLCQHRACRKAGASVSALTPLCRGGRGGLHRLSRRLPRGGHM